MLDPIFSFFEKLISDFTWRRLAFVIAVIALGLVTLFAYEGYTSSFALNRIEKESALLQHLLELSKNNEIEFNTALQRSYDTLASDLENVVIKQSVEPNSLLWSTFPVWALKLISAIAPWFLLGLTLMLSPKDRKERSSTVTGVIIVAIPFVVIGLALPVFEKTWINHFLYPWGTCSFVIISILFWQTLKGNT